VKTKLNSVACVRERTIPTERLQLFGEVSTNFLRIEGVTWSVTDPYGSNLGFLDRSRYFFFQVAPQLYSRVRVNPVQDPLLLRKSGRAGNLTRYLWICSQELLATRPQRRSKKCSVITKINCSSPKRDRWTLL
jgi:hypothetical protein